MKLNNIAKEHYQWIVDMKWSQQPLPKGSGLKKPNFLGNNSFLELWIDQTQVANYLASYVR